MCANRAGALEKPPLSKKAKLCVGVVTSTSPPSISLSNTPSGTTDQPSLFVQTQVYNDLYQRVKRLASHKSNVNNIQVIGPKGIGKTWALQELAKVFEDVDYVDLSMEKPQPLQSKKKFLLIDNAQKVTSDMVYDGIREKTIVAAFSPGARVKDGSKILAKMCGDGRHRLFFWRPFTWNEAQVLVSKLGYTIAAKTDFEKEEISMRHLRSLYCKTSGIPRYMASYLIDNDLAFMILDLEEQYKGMVNMETLEALNMSSEDVNTTIVSLLSSGKCLVWDPPCVIGCAYSTTSKGINKWKPVHPYYMFKALRMLENPLNPLKWQQLETITQVMLRADVVVSGKNGSLSVKGADTVLYQDYIGSKPPQIEVLSSVILLVLAQNHNVIDSILYDLRGTPKVVYFVQTSSLEYSKKKKSLSSLADPVKCGRKVLSDVSIANHYTDVLGRNQKHYYIYATTDLTGSKGYSDVYFMNLLAFCPNYSSIYEVGDGDSDSDSD